MAQRPIGVHVAKVGPVYAQIAWDAQSDSTGYVVELAATGAVVARTGPAESMATLGGLIPRSSYVFRVFSLGRDGSVSPPSAPVEVRTP